MLVLQSLELASQSSQSPLQCERSHKTHVTPAHSSLYHPPPGDHLLLDFVPILLVFLPQVRFYFAPRLDLRFLRDLRDV